MKYLTVSNARDLKLTRLLQDTYCCYSGEPPGVEKFCFPPIILKAGLLAAHVMSYAGSGSVIREEYGVLQGSAGAHLPDKIYRHPHEHDQKSESAVCGTGEEEIDADEHGENEIQGRHPWIGKDLDRSRLLWPFATQCEEADRGQYIKQNGCKNNVFQQLAVGAGNAQHTGPDGLENQRRGRCVILRMEHTDRFEEELVLCHGVIDAGAGENKAIIAAQG